MPLKLYSHAYDDALQEAGMLMEPSSVRTLEEAVAYARLCPEIGDAPRLCEGIAALLSNVQPTPGIVTGSVSAESRDVARKFLEDLLLNLRRGF